MTEYPIKKIFQHWWFSAIMDILMYFETVRFILCSFFPPFLFFWFLFSAIKPLTNTIFAAGSFHTIQVDQSFSEDESLWLWIHCWHRMPKRFTQIKAVIPNMGGYCIREQPSGCKNSGKGTRNTSCIQTTVSLRLNCLCHSFACSNTVFSRACSHVYSLSTTDMYRMLL